MTTTDSRQIRSSIDGAGRKPTRAVAMTEFSRPVVVISRCIDFDSCRYNGQVVRASIRDELEAHVDLMPICPELEIGLGVPREPIRMVARPGEVGLVQPSTGLDVTQEMRAFSSRFLDRVRGVDGFILKSGSPSCGIRGIKVYGGAQSSGVVSAAAGRFAAAVLERFPYTVAEDEGRLNDMRLREHFLTRIFTSAGLRQVLAAEKPSGLVRFHGRNKLLLLAYNERRLRRLGRIVANSAREPFSAVIARYEAELAPALARPPQTSAHVNVLMHALGHLSGRLGSAEKAQFLNSLEFFRRGRLPVSALLEVLRSWAARFGDRHLGDQTFLSPFPPELVRLEPLRQRRRRLAAEAT
jgi:uncharacterized protein YbgA (DUF1722 family)/uncharacterized protein YbbK (DUF523 family)